VVLTPKNGDLPIGLGSQLASMLKLCAGPRMQKVSAGVTEKALQSKLLAGTALDGVTRPHSGDLMASLAHLADAKIPEYQSR
jgi:hypothetical protein